MHNPTVDVLLDRRSIRAFQQEPIDPQILTTIEAAAQHAASSQYLNDWSAIRILDHTLKQQIAEVGHQPYIADAAALYVFVLDEYRNAVIARNSGVVVDSDEFTLSTTATASAKPRTTPYSRCTRWRPRRNHSVWVV